MASKTQDTSKTLIGKEVAVVEAASNAVIVGGVTYGIAKRVNVPTLKHESNETVVVRFEDEIREVVNVIEDEGYVNGQLTKITRENILHVARVTEMSSGQPFEYVLNAITNDNIEGAYLNKTYVGRVFAIQKLGLVAGKRYKEVNIVELEMQVPA